MRRENDALKSDIVQLRINSDAMKDENKTLKSIIKVENIPLTENDNLMVSASLLITGTRQTLKVSQWSGIYHMSFHLRHACSHYCALDTPSN